MTALLAPLPLLLVIGLLATGRASALGAGSAGLLATLGVVATVGVPGGGMPGGGISGGGASGALALLSAEAPAGLWLAWPVIAIIIAGMFFHRAVSVRQAGTAASTRAVTAPRLWSLCFLLAPFAESVTGFGVGYVIALAALRGLGIVGMPALLLGLFSQSLVPWGALAVGTTVGAALAGMTPAELGWRTAIVQAPIHALYLLLYWRYARAAGVTVSRAQRIDDAAWTAALLALIAIANRVADPEIAAAAPCALLLALRHWRDDRPSAAQWRAVAQSAAPYAALVLALCLTRLVAPLREALLQIAPWAPLAGKPAFAPLYAPGFWVIAIGTIVALRSATPLGRLAAETARAAWRPCAVTAVFLLMAQLYQAAGLAEALAGALQALARDAALYAVPPMAAVGGFLTGSAAAASAMLMPMEIALARAMGLDPGWMAAVQNAVSANLSMLSPIRVSMGVAVAGLAIGEAALYRKAWPLALPPLLGGLAAIALMAA
jgi:lactate permease